MIYYFSGKPKYNHTKLKQLFIQNITTLWFWKEVIIYTTIAIFQYNRSHEENTAWTPHNIFFRLVISRILCGSEPYYFYIFSFN